jgi:hypothetical protein
MEAAIRGLIGDNGPPGVRKTAGATALLGLDLCEIGVTQRFTIAGEKEVRVFVADEGFLDPLGDDGCGLIGGRR